MLEATRNCHACVCDFDKGASIKYVRYNFGIFDPLPPVVLVCTIWGNPPLCGRPNLAWIPPPNFTIFWSMNFWRGKEAKPEMQEERCHFQSSYPNCLFSWKFWYGNIWLQNGIKCGHPNWPRYPPPLVRNNLFFHAPPWVRTYFMEAKISTQSTTSIKSLPVVCYF